MPSNAAANAETRSRPRRRNATQSRDRIVQAASREFSARGFDAAGVDRIARRARVNKALIYYYFGSKLSLYRTVLRTQMAALVDALRRSVEGSDEPARKLDRYIEALVGHVVETSDLTSLILRELADGGRHLDADILREMVSLPTLLFTVITQEREPRGPTEGDVLMLHFMLTGTTLLMASNKSIRSRVRQMRLAQPPADTRDIVARLQAFARRALRKDQ